MSDALSSARPLVPEFLTPSPSQTSALTYPRFTTRRPPNRAVGSVILAAHGKGRDGFPGILLCCHFSPPAPVLAPGHRHCRVEIAALTVEVICTFGPPEGCREDFR